MNTTRRGFLISASGLVLTAGLPSLPRAAGYRTEAVQEVVDGDGVLALFSVIRDHPDQVRHLNANVMAWHPKDRNVQRWAFAVDVADEYWAASGDEILEDFEHDFVDVLRLREIRYVRPVTYPAGASRFERIYWKRITG